MRRSAPRFRHPIANGHRFLCRVLPALLFVAPVHAAQTNVALLVRHGPTLNGNGLICGSVQQLLGENVTLNGGFDLDGDLLVPGTPTLRTNGHPVFAGLSAGSGNSAPTGYSVTLNGNCTLGRLRTRVDPVAIPSVPAPPSPAGTRNVTITSSVQSIGDAATLRNLTVNGNVGLVAVPPGTYGVFTANGAGGFTLGVEGSTQPCVYNFQGLSLNGQSRLNILSPVIVTVAGGFTANGILGATNHPGWFELQIAAGGCTLNGGSTMHANVTAPSGTLTVNGNSSLIGSARCDRLIVNGGGSIQAAARVNQKPTACSQNLSLLEGTSTNITLSGSDADGDALSFRITAPPSHGSLNPQTSLPGAFVYVPATGYSGQDSFMFSTSDGVEESDPATVIINVRHINVPPVVSVLFPIPESEATLGEAIPIQVAAADSDGEVERVAIWTEDSVIAEWPHPPYEAIWTNATLGDHLLSALAMDDSGAVSFSGPVAISVLEPEGGDFVVDAGPDQLACLAQRVLLAGSIEISRPFGDAETNVSWTKISGPGEIDFDDSHELQTGARFSAPGAYVIKLRIRYAGGNRSDTLAVDILPEASDRLTAARSSRGTEFWLMFLPNLHHPGEVPYIASELIICAAEDTAGKVDFSIAGEPREIPFRLPPGSSTNVVLWDYPVNGWDPSDTIVADAIHVTADHAIAVHGLNIVQESADGFLALPACLSGTNYMVLSYRNARSFLDPESVIGGTEFGVVSSEDDTHVIITPTAGTDTRTAGVPFELTLQKGETYRLVNEDEQEADFTGTTIAADKPIAVFAGSKGTLVPTDYAAADHLVEQLPPVEIWGREFVAMPLATRTGNTLRVLAQTNNTRVAINGKVVGILDRGQFHEALVDAPVQILSSQPVLVAQYAHGTTYDWEPGDPFMMLTPPVDQFGGDYIIATAPPVWNWWDQEYQNLYSNYLNLVVRSNGVGRIILDGCIVPADQFQLIGDTGYAGAQVAVDVGAHHLSSTVPFGACVYGWSECESYGFPGGIYSESLNAGARLALAQPTAFAAQGHEKAVSAIVTSAEGRFLADVDVEFAVAGANAAAGRATTSRFGEATFSYRGTNLGADVITARAADLAQSVTNIWLGEQSNSPPDVSTLATRPGQFGRVIQLAGTVVDDGRPPGGALRTHWHLCQGPSEVQFENPAQPDTTATCVEPGNYVFEFEADDSQFSAWSVVNVFMVRPFTVDLYGPEPGAWFASNATFSFSAGINIVEGCYTNVEFYDGERKLCEGASTDLVLDGLPPGDHCITAVVTEEHGFQVRSQPISFWVTAPPVIESAAPASDLTLPYGDSTATITARAWDPDGTITNFEVYLGPTLLCQVTNGDMDFIGPLDAGDAFYEKYSTCPLRFTATDDHGVSTELYSVNVTLEPPAIGLDLICPAEDQVCVAGRPIHFQAEASVPAPARITGVGFFRRMSTWGYDYWDWLEWPADDAPPFTVDWTPPGPGDYEFAAYATTDVWTYQWTPARHVHVVPPPLPRICLSFVPENQTNALVGNPALVEAKIDMTTPVGIAKVEFFADGLPWAETTNGPYLLPYIATNPGPHALTARVTTEFGTVAESLPLTIQSHVQLRVMWESVRSGDWVPVGTNRTLGIRLVDPGSIFQDVEFVANGVSLADTPFTFIDWRPPSAGDYRFLARAHDIFGNSYESEELLLHAAVLGDPQVQFISPSPMARVQEGDPVRFIVHASSPDSAVTNLSLSRTSVSEVSSPNGDLECDWTNLPPGPHDFIAVATDDKGLTGQAKVSVFVEYPVAEGLLPPHDFTAAALGCNAIRLSWSTNPGVACKWVVVERTEGASNVWRIAGKVPFTRASFVDHFLTPASEYRYRAYSLNDDGCRSVDTVVVTGRTRAYLPGFAVLDMAENLEDAGAFAVSGAGHSPAHAAFVRYAIQDNDDAAAVGLDGFFTLGISDLGSVLLAGGSTNFIWSPSVGYQSLDDTNFYPFRMTRCGVAVGTHWAEVPVEPSITVTQYHAGFWADGFEDLTPDPQALRLPPTMPELKSAYPVMNTLSDMTSVGQGAGSAYWVWVASEDGLTSWRWLGPLRQATCWLGTNLAPFAFGSLQQLGNESSFEAINDSGDLVGVSSLHDPNWPDADVSHAIRSHVSLAGTMGDKLTDLGTLGGLYSAAVSINSAGIAVGYSTVSPEDAVTNTRAVYWLPADVQPRPLPGYNSNVLSYAHAVNDRNQIAGEAVDEGGTQQAVLWSPSPLPIDGMSFDLVNLNDLIHTSDWQLHSARSINQAGWITGSGYHLTEVELSDGTRRFVMAPRVFVLVPNVSIAIDFNRDGRIDLDDRDDLPAGQPYQFWVNDDSDSGFLDNLLGTSDLPGAQSGGLEFDGRDPDYTDEKVNGAGDLTDWFPVYLNISNLLAILPPSQYTYCLVQAQGALNFLYTDLRPDQAGGYLTNGLTSGFGPDFMQPAGTASGVQQVTEDGVALSPEFLGKVASDGRGILLMEARQPTTQSLRLEVRNQRRVVASLELPLQISGVEEMYSWVNLRPVAGEAADRDTDLNPQNPPLFAREDHAFVFVHGYNVNELQSRAWSAEMFKRLWWSGSLSRFYAVSWHGEDTQVAAQATINYHVNVQHAFETAPVFGYLITNLLSGQDITVAAHSLGNMVVCAAVQDWGAAPRRYYMVNGAVAMEAFDATLTNEPAMTHPDWRNYPDRLHASEWHRLFGESDGRHELTWRGRFRDVPRRTRLYNFYSTGEEVLENRQDDSDPWISDLLSLQFQVPAFKLPVNWLQGRLAWALQEMLKGRMTSSDMTALYAAGCSIGGVPAYLALRLADVRAGNLVGSQDGGWGFNSYWDTSGSFSTVNGGAAPVVLYVPGGHLDPARAEALSDADLRDHPFFLPFLDPRLTSSGGGALASDPNVQVQLLAEAIPARTFAVGANGLAGINHIWVGASDFDMNTEFQKFGWPPERMHNTRTQSRWKHSDIHDVPYSYTFMLFDQWVRMELLP